MKEWAFKKKQSCEWETRGEWHEAEFGNLSSKEEELWFNVISASTDKKTKHLQKKKKKETEQTKTGNYTLHKLPNLRFYTYKIW